MFIPIGTEIEHRRPPTMTMALIAANFVVAILVLAAARSGDGDVQRIISAWAVGRDGFRPWQLLTSMFMHDLSGVMHLAGNMLFLWVFGSAVEQRLGRLPFLAFYLLGGAVAGVTHVIFSAAPAVGASGAVSAVLGAYLVLFPLAQVRVVFFLFIWGLGTIPAWWVIGLYVALDIASQLAEWVSPERTRNVAYMAHIGGTAFGVATAMFLLRARLVHRSQWDLLALLKQSARRRTMRNIASRGEVWHADLARRQETDAAHASDAAPRPRRRGAPPPPPPASPAGSESGTQAESSSGSGRTAARAALDPTDVSTRRGEIVAMLGRGAGAEAVDAYRRLAAEAPGASLPSAHQLEIANRLLANDLVPEAAAAYELFLQTAPKGPQADEVQLVLGMIYVRRQPDPSRARRLLEQVRSRLRADQRTLADELLAELAT